MDRHSEEFETLKQKVTEPPRQASVLLKRGAGKLAPYVLGGPGWDRRRVASIDAPDERT
ncbi:hypothetical protein BH18ACI5_BH18ACI5_19450 [soil metagenome]